MAEFNQETIKQALLTAAGQKVADALTKKTADAVGKRMLSLMIERIISNKDIYGRPFPTYSAKYLAWKMKFLSGKATRGRRGKVSRTMQKLLTQSKGNKYAAKSVNDKVRLTGNFLGNLNYKVRGIRNNVKAVYFDVVISVGAGYEKQAQGLWKKGYYALGMRKDSAGKDYEANEIAKVIQQTSKGKLL